MNWPGLLNDSLLIPISKRLATAILFFCWLVGINTKLNGNPPHHLSALVDQDHLTVNLKLGLVKFALLEPPYTRMNCDKAIGSVLSDFRMREGLILMQLHLLKELFVRAIY